jgi:hypothetical protein
MALHQAQRDNCFVALLVMGDIDSGANPHGAVDLSNLAQLLEPMMRPDDTLARGPADSTLLVVCNRVACAGDGEMIAARCACCFPSCAASGARSAGPTVTPISCSRERSGLWVLDQERRADATHN